MTIKFIAEIGSNHNQDLSRTEELIKTAKQIGCEAVKFQLFRADHLYAKGFPQREKLKKQELPASLLPEISKMCKNYGMEFHCTPFDIEAVSVLKPYVDAYKIGSYEILNLPLIIACAESGKPVSLSGGNATMEEVATTFRETRMRNHRVTVYHCSGHYPAPPSYCNLHQIVEMHKRFEKIGWSDHSVNPAVVNFAIALGASIIEFHLDLDDMEGGESWHGHCWSPKNAQNMIVDARKAEPALRPFVDSSDIHKWRADPEDGMRPLKQYRKELFSATR